MGWALSTCFPRSWVTKSRLASGTETPAAGPQVHSEKAPGLAGLAGVSVPQVELQVPPPTSRVPSSPVPRSSPCAALQPLRCLSELTPTTGPLHVSIPLPGEFFLDCPVSFLDHPATLWRCPRPRPARCQGVRHSGPCLALFLGRHPRPHLPAGVTRRPPGQVTFRGLWLDQHLW